MVPHAGKPAVIAHHVTCECEWCLGQRRDARLTVDPRKLANVGAQSVRGQGLLETLAGLQTMGATLSADQYKHLMRGVARQLNRDAATQT